MKYYKKKTVRCILLSALLILTLSCSLLLGGCSDSSVENLFMSTGVLHIDSESDGFYAYETLDEETRLVYDQIVYAISERKEDFRLATTDLKVMKKAYQAVRYDHCEFFWLKKFSYEVYQTGDTITAIDFQPVFSMSEKKQKETQDKIDTAVNKLLKNAPKDGSDFDKVLYVYRKIIGTVDYDKDSKNNQNIISTFLNHKTVCEGYAYGVQYLLRELGIECTTVEGSTEGESHAWNLVKMDGRYYYLDATWGNSQYVSYLDGSKQSSGKYIDYYYMAMTSQEIATTHSPSKAIPMPSCNSTEDNYFVHEGLYFDSWDAAAIGNRIKQAYKAGEKKIQIEFSDMDLFDQAVQYFIEDYKIRNYCRGLKKIRYMEITDKNILYIRFCN